MVRREDGNRPEEKKEKAGVEKGQGKRVEERGGWQGGSGGWWVEVVGRSGEVVRRPCPGTRHEARGTRHEARGSLNTKCKKIP